MPPSAAVKQFVTEDLSSIEAMRLDWGNDNRAVAGDRIYMGTSEGVFMAAQHPNKLDVSDAHVYPSASKHYDASRQVSKMLIGDDLQ